MASTPKALIFDLGNVLVAFDFQRGYDRLQSLCGHPVAEIRRRIGNSGLVPQLEAGQVASRDFVSKLGAELGVSLDYAQFCEIWGSVFLPGALIPESLIAGLKQRYRLVLLSNTNAMHFEMLERTYPILGHFENRGLDAVPKSASSPTMFPSTWKAPANWASMPSGSNLRRNWSRI